MDAGACGFSIQRLGPHSIQADVDGTPMPTDCMEDADVLALAEVLRDRDEGFIQITQAQGGDPNHRELERKGRDRRFLSFSRKSRSARFCTMWCRRSTSGPDFHEKELAWLHNATTTGLRIYGQAINVRRLVHLHPGALESLRFKPGVERRDARHDRREDADARRSRCA
jgi:hypothetical protein